MPIARRQRRKAPPEDSKDIWKLHPPGVKIYRHGYREDQIVEAYVFESPPMKMGARFSWLDKKEVKRNAKYQIQLPWTYFIMKTQGHAYRACYVWFADKQAVDLQEPVFMAPFPNVFGVGNVCTGSASSEVGEIQSFKKASEVVQKLFGYFLNSGFNTESWTGSRLIPDGWAKFQRTTAWRFFEQWQEKGKEGPIRWKKFRPSGGKKYVETLDDAINYALSRDHFG